MADMPASTPPFPTTVLRPHPTGAPRLFLNGKFYGGAVNGVHRVADRLLRELDRQAKAGGLPAGWDMRLFVPERGHAAPQFETIQMLPQRFGHTQLWEQAWLPFAARGGVLASFANLAPGLHSRKLTMVHDAQFRLSPRSYPLKLRLGYRLLIPRGARSSQRVLTVSGYAKDMLATFGVADPERTAILYNGADHIIETAADPGILARSGLTPGRFALLFGSTARYKNIDVVLDAFRSPALAGLSLAIVGPARAALVPAGLRPPVNSVFLETVDDAGLRALYEAAHCLLYPSRTEGFGLPPVEAMLCGCPVVAAPAGAIPEVGRDAPTYAAMDEADEWVGAVLSLRDPGHRAAKVAAGRVRAAAFTWRSAGERLAALLAPLLEGRAG